MKKGGLTGIVGLVLLACWGCAETQDPAGADIGEAVLALGTSFEATGLMTEEALVQVDAMRFPHARLTLEHADGAVVESAPFELEFAPIEGLLTVSGPALELPEMGSWRVFFEVLPEEPGAKQPGESSHSLVVQGLWFFGETATEPSPLPWHESAERRDVRAPSSFRYLSGSGALVEIGSVIVDADSASLEFDLDFLQWRVQVLEPAVAELFDVETDAEAEAQEPASGAGGGMPERGERPLPDTVRDADGVGLMNLLERVSARAEGPAR